MLSCWPSAEETVPKRYVQVFKERSTRDAFVLDPVKMAVSPDGKYAFIIGSRKIVITSESNPTEWTTSFKLDVFDLSMEGRRTILLNDLFDFGDYLVHIYALDSSTLIVLDYNHRQTTLRQRIIKIAQNVAISPFHRCYHYGTSQTSFIKAAIGDRLCAIMNSELHAALSLNICHYIAPFFSHNDRDLCFLTTNSLTLNIEPTNVSCLNLCSYKWYSRDAIPDEVSGFPRDEYQQTPILVDCFICQNGNQQIGLVARFRTPPSHWRWQICSLLQWIQMRLVRLFFLSMDVQADTFGKIILYFTTFLSYLRDRLVLRPYARLGILNLRSWKWIDYTYMLKDIHYVDQLTDLANESGQIVSFISQTWAENECEQSIRLGKSPVSMMSLFTIADFELRRRGNPKLRSFRRQFLEHTKI
uniref:F-box associated domain-containing protein n=1 Tax=Setaria digitata TaxID=48799 RepID=A0A915PNC7_9BILA